jgi:hypothetical protein
VGCSVRFEAELVDLNGGLAAVGFEELDSLVGGGLGGLWGDWAGLGRAGL